MRNVTMLLLFMIVTYCHIHAQNKGDLIVGGSLGYNTNKISSNLLNGSKENILIAPIIGIMLSNYISVGAELAYAKLDNDADGFGDPNIELLSISPFLRHQVNFSPKFKVYGEPHCGFAIDLADRIKEKTQYYNFGYNIGLICLITQRLSV